MLDIKSTAKLNNGQQMPILGLGVWQMAKGQETANAVLRALQVGYRHIDTAKIYGNEESVGEAIRKSGIARDEIFVTTKLWNDDHGDPEKALDQSLQRLGMDYVDLYLIHWPGSDSDNLETWKVMEKFPAAGKCRAVGVSNFSITHLKELLAHSELMPAVNQVEFHPYLYQKDLLQYCSSENIQLEAYSPLTKGQRLEDPKLLAIAQKYSKSAAQILIRWSLQLGLVVIPKSADPVRIKENSEVFDFEISPEDMERLNAFDENLRLVSDD